MVSKVDALRKETKKVKKLMAIKEKKKSLESFGYVLNSSRLTDGE